MRKIYDVVTIGAGPIGLFASFTAADKGLSAALVDAQPHVGGQLTALYPQKFIFDVAGYPKVSASELVEELNRQVRQHEVPILLEFKVVGLSREPEGDWKLTAEDGRYVHAKYVLIAAGAGMIQPRKLEIEDPDRYYNKGFEYVVREVEEYRNRRVLVIGGGDTALDWANYFTGISKDVTLIHRTQKFVGFEGSLKRLQQTSCQIIMDTKLIGIKGDSKVEAAVIQNVKDNSTKELPVDRILGCLGFIPKLGFIKEHGFEIAEGSIKSDANMRTTVENIYAVGDISNHPGRIKLISTGFGNVQIALNHIVTLESELRDDLKVAVLEARAQHRDL